MDTEKPTLDIASLGIPTLDLSMDAWHTLAHDADGMSLGRIVLPRPVLPYGAVGRHVRTGGTRHFYVDDAKFSGLWGRPETLLASACVVVVEVNYSTSAELAPWQALYDIARKRALARFWQSRGVHVLVDLNVELRFAEFALLGVPNGWRGYATRAHRHAPGSGDTVEVIERQFRQAIERAGTDDIAFVVVGGGKRVREACQGNRWTNIPERAREVRSARPVEISELR